MPSTSQAKAPPRQRRNPLDPARVHAILDGLTRAYPDAECALHHRNAWQLLVATILSAQCTDVRVNMVTPALFQKYPSPAALVRATAEAGPELIEPDIRSTGFYHNKAKSITGAARRIVETYQGKVPDTMEALLTLPGVARKTANVVLGVWFHQAAGVVVDTHVQRVSSRLELASARTPEQIEQQLQRVIPRDHWIAFSHRVIAHGRACCVARKPKCAACPIEPLCRSKDKTFSTV